eukprot:6179100-Pleurochrysis_carterae.AAC.2
MVRAYVTLHVNASVPTCACVRLCVCACENGRIVKKTKDEQNHSDEIDETQTGGKGPGWGERCRDARLTKEARGARLRLDVSAEHLRGGEVDLGPDEEVGFVRWGGRVRVGIVMLGGS